MIARIKEFLLGKPKDPLDPGVFHNVSLIAFFAWVGLGADGLSSSCYGPEEAFLSLGTHGHLALWLAIAVMATVFVLSASYAQIIELFPSGGGGYLVATKLVGPLPGLVSGCALLVDYVLTIAISLASGMDAIFSFIPPSLHQFKFTATVVALLVLMVLNLRGIKESVKILTPIFLVFLITHVFFIVYGLVTHGDGLPNLVNDTIGETRNAVNELGGFAVAMILLRAFSLGGGTFTGIEAVSNGIQILREPRVATGKRTMFYMALSLSLTAGGLLISYVLNDVSSIPGKTLNAVLFDQLVARWPLGHALVLLTLVSEGALLFVAAQTGFIGGPRVMANMALDRWMPRRFTALSDRLVMKDGILVMGIAVFATLLYTKGAVSILIVMYSINVFLTFALSQFGMVRHWIQQRGPGWLYGLSINSVSLIITTGMLLVTSFVKFGEGGWVTIAVTSIFVGVCLVIRRHYHETIRALKDLNQVLGDLPLEDVSVLPEKQRNAPTAVLMVSGYNGIGIHSILAIQRFFPGHFKNMVFISVGAIDSDRFKGKAELESLQKTVQQDLDRYVKLSQKLGFYGESQYAIGTDIVEELVDLCRDVNRRWQKKVYFMGQLAFEGETFWNRLLHNQTSFLLQKKLLFEGYEAVILPIRMRLDK
jgi:amino acid transporter